MALYANGDPLPLRDGVALVSAQVSYGTAVTPATSLGAVRCNHTKQGNAQAFFGPGSANAFAIKGGSTPTEWELSWEAIQAGVKPMLVRAVRPAKVLPVFTLGLGYADDTGTPAKSADQIQDCKVGQLNMSLDASGGHGPLTANMSGLGGLVTPLTTLSPATFATGPFYSYEAVLESDDGGGAAGFPVRSFSLAVNHNLRHGYRIPGATPGSFIRGPFALVEHFENISGSISLFTRSGEDPHADTLQELDWTLTFTNLSDASTIAITLGDLVLSNERFEMSDEGLIWSCDYIAKTFGLS